MNKRQKRIVKIVAVILAVAMIGSVVYSLAAIIISMKQKEEQEKAMQAMYAKLESQAQDQTAGS